MNGPVYSLAGHRPADARGFLHKKIFGAVSTIAGIVSPVIPGASAISTFTGRLSGRSGAAAPPTPGIPFDSKLRTFGNGNGVKPCPEGLKRSPMGNCVFPGSPRGREVFEGQAVMGRFGPAAVADVVLRETAVCPKGMALGKDELCYDHLPNRDRKYPRGRRPLLTGGDMRAISRARRAGNRLSTAKSDLIAIGMLKSAPAKRRKKAAIPCA